MIETILYGIFAFSFLLILGLLILIFLQKYAHARAIKRTQIARNYFYKLINEDKDLPAPKLHPLILFDEFFKVEDQIRFSSKERERILINLPNKAFLRIMKRKLKSLSSYKRILGSQYLALIHQDDAKSLMIKRLKKERKEPVKFYLVYGLLSMVNKEILDLSLKSCEGASFVYTRKLVHLLSNHYQTLYPYIEYKDHPNLIERFFYANLAKDEPQADFDAFLKQELKTILGSSDQTLSQIEKQIQTHTLHALLSRDSSLLANKKLLEHKSFDVRKFTYQYFAKKEELKFVKLLFNCLSSDQDENKFIVHTIQESLSETNLFDQLLSMMDCVSTEEQKNALASLMSSRIDYLLMELSGDENQRAVRAIEFLVKRNYTAGLISFINQNKDRAMEDHIFSIIHAILENNKDIKKSFTTYLKEEILKRHNLEQTILEQPKRQVSPVEVSKIIWMIVILSIVVLTYPLLSFMEQGMVVFQQPFIDTFKALILDTNRNLIFYFMAANFIYLVLLAISLRGAKRQRNLWNIKREKLLYQPNILPSISIIAPAYNEELSIITSVQSLLNLKYPKYEVVVVNDGSKDQTLQKLIDYFDLKRQDVNDIFPLKTKDIRGIYSNPRYPKLKVINKVNGGKADALNVGINLASYTYVCGIDADSVLEQEALLRLMSITLDHKEEPVALGGNIVPANGCKIDHGYIEEKALPKELIPKFQSLEYLRAFTSGRIGWSSLKSLLIISGAFGLFKKEDIVQIGGYITSSGDLKKDSVGEDMELVVRLTHQKMKKKEPYLISYVYHANCYTELPGDLPTLLKQRNRWHRGLIDILSYHRHMLFRVKYKQIGFFAFPYFYIFEVMGPFFELIGYLALIASFIFAFLSPIIVLGIFAASILMGIVLSLSSLYIAETVNTYTSKKDVFALIFFAIFENLGYRQLISMHRVYSFFSALFEKGVWGEQKRKGL